MNTLNWLCSKARPSKPSLEQSASANSTPASASAPPQPIQTQPEPTYNDLADHFAALHNELAQAKAEILKARQKFHLAQTDLDGARKEIKSLRAKNNDQANQIQGFTVKVTRLNKAATDASQQAKKNSDSQKNQKNEIQRLQVRCSKLDKDKSDLTKQHNTIVTGLKLDQSRLLKQQEEVQEQYRALRRQHGETLFELEHFKCVERPSVDWRSLPLVPQPFVVVLIDGDAYSWTSSLFAFQNPGALAAFKIQQNVEAHLSSLSSVSPYVKIITRAFINGMGAERHRINKTTTNSKYAFMRQFTEAFPLFDFFDCGAGKERADFKIKDNFQLYLSNPNCQHIYLATCTDNGFARMLEPYRYHSIRKNITLVSPGWMCRDLQALDFEVITWPDIFSTVHAPKEVQMKESRRQSGRAKDAAHNKRLGLEGKKIGWIADAVADFAEEILDEPLVDKCLRSVSSHNANVGVRSQRCREAKARVAMVAEDEVDTDVDLEEVD